MSLSKAKQLREDRAAIAVKMGALVAAGLTAESTVQFDAMNKDQEALKGQIDRIERSEALDAEMRERGSNHNPTIDDPAKRGFKDVAERNAKYRKAFFRALAIDPNSKSGLKPSTSQHMQARGNTDEQKGLRWIGEDVDGIKATLDSCVAHDAEFRDQQAGVNALTYTQGAAGGYFVPTGFVYDVEIATKFFAPLADGSVIRIMETATGNTLPYPTNNDTNEAWTILGEAQQVSDQGQTPNYSTSGTAPSGQPGNLTLGVVNFGAYKGTTGLVRVSLELLQDSAFDLEDFLKNAFAVRLGRGYEYYLTRGSGISQPTGILTAVVASGQAATIATGSSTNDGTSATGTTSIGTNDLMSLEHSIDPTYRRGGKFMFHDNTLLKIKQLLDKYGRPIWVPGLAVNAPDTVLGYSYVVNQSMPQIAASANTVLFGSLQKFIMRKVRDLSVLRLDERFADFGEVAYVAFSRIDSNLVDSGVHPIGFLQQHS